MRTELKHLHEQLKATFVYVTHDQAEAMTMAERIVVMRDGYIQQLGGPLEIYRRPANGFVAGFFGIPTMNFIQGTLEGKAGNLVFRAKNLEQSLPPGTHLENGGRAVTLGIRSEHVLVGKGSKQGRVTLTEPMGDETLVRWEDGRPLELSVEFPPSNRFQFQSQFC
jgi:multiple sugar transport system ATP-binding protein